MSGTLEGFAPVYTLTARVLVLGSFPGKVSLAHAQYYAHPQNQFWRIIGHLLGERLSDAPYERRLQKAVASGMAIWDIHGRCQRQGSLDSAIRSAQPNDLVELVDRLTDLGAIAFNGRAASQAAPLFQGRGLSLLSLPSTSPAYAMMRFEQKLAAWRALEPYLHP